MTPPAAAIRAGRAPHRLSGPAVAAATAMISGVSVFVNGYGVHALSSPAVYTTAKNLVAAVVLLGLGALPWRRAGSGAAGRPFTAGMTGSPWRWIGLAYIGVIGGGLAFVLFFTGLAHTQAAPAAFWKDTLVIWVALMAAPFLRERLAWWNLAAIALLVVGQVVVAGGVGHLAVDRGELLVLASSVLWAVEVVVAKALLPHMAAIAVARVRMAAGAVTLVAYLGVTGEAHRLWSLNGHQLAWVVLTGCLLAGYVATWMTALSRARALDVTSILVGSAAVTWLLQWAAGTTPAGARSLGLVLVGVGAGGALWASAQGSRARRRPVTP